MCVIDGTSRVDGNVCDDSRYKDISEHRDNGGQVNDPRRVCAGRTVGCVNDLAILLCADMKNYPYSDCALRYGRLSIVRENVIVLYHG